MSETTTSNSTAGSTAAEFTLERRLAAPIARVWRAWTHPDELTAWLHPEDLRSPRPDIFADVREGGRYRYVMADPTDGARYPAGGTYLEVDEPHRLVFTWSVGGRGEGTEVLDDATAPVATVTLTADGPEHTLCRFHLRGVPGAAPGDDGVHDGWTSALDILDRHVDLTEDALGFTLIRRLDAPVDRVWRAWTEPDAMADWLSGLGTTRDSVHADLRVGGRYGYTMSDDASGARFPTGGHYLVVDPPRLLEFTWGDPDVDDDVLPRITVTLTPLGDDRTDLHFRLRGFAGEPGDGYVHDGWVQALALIADSVS